MLTSADSTSCTLCFRAQTLLLVFVMCVLGGVASQPAQPPARSLSGLLPQPNPRMAVLVEPQGYPLEEHQVETADGYLLGVFRIPWGLTGAGRPSQGGGPRKPIVLLEHGLLLDSSSWVINGRNLSLAFMLANAGYDVWMGNSRGNTFSRRHVSLTTQDRAFWAFSYDEMAAYDLPAELRYVLAVGGQEQLLFVAHSQGTTNALALMTTQPAMAAKFKVAVMMSPVTFLAHLGSPYIKLLAQLKADEITALFGYTSFLPSNATSILLEPLCNPSPRACLDAAGTFFGSNEANLNLSRLDLYVSYFPAGTSVQNVQHWVQGVRQPPGAQQFLRFDYGTACLAKPNQPNACNTARYGQPLPPAYDLSLVRTPLALISGGQDKLSDPTDVAELSRRLPPGVKIYEQQLPAYEHQDFIWGINTHELVYPTVMRLLAQYR